MPTSRQKAHVSLDAKGGSAHTIGQLGPAQMGSRRKQTSWPAGRMQRRLHSSGDKRAGDALSSA